MLYRRLGDAGVFRSVAAGLEHQSAPFVLWLAEGGSGIQHQRAEEESVRSGRLLRPASQRRQKIALTEWTTDRIGLPLLREALAWFECQVVGEHPAGDHV